MTMIMMMMTMMMMIMITLHITLTQVWPVMLADNLTKAGGKKVLGHCVPGCVDYEFDDR